MVVMQMLVYGIAICEYLHGYYIGANPYSQCVKTAGIHPKFWGWNTGS